MRDMSRRRNLVLWFSFASIPLAALVIVLAVALKPAHTEASRRIKKIEPGMTRDQVRAAMGMESSSVWRLSEMMLGEGPEQAMQTGAGWDFPDESAISVTFDEASRVIESHELIRESKPWYARIRDTLRKAGLPL